MNIEPICVEAELGAAIDSLLTGTFKRSKNPLKAVKKYHKALKYIERVQKAISKKKVRKRKP